MKKNKANEAFKILIKEINALVVGLNEEGVQALRAGDHKKALETIKEAGRVSDFLSKVKDIQKEWAKLFSKKRGVARKAGIRKIKTKSIIRLPGDLYTSEKEFRKPILESLVELGGRAKKSDVLKKIELKMKNIFKKFDCKPLPSIPHSHRWQISAQSCRNKLLQEGFIKNDSPRGIWEISEKGRKWLEDK